jgi:phage host-nuclease inhibitor protein Gam
VPQSREAAADAIFEIGTIDRDLQRLDADLKDRLALVKQAFEEKALPLKEQRTALIEGVKVFCEGRRDELTNGGRVKTAAFTSGEVSWRLRPPSVKIRGGEDELVKWLMAQNNDLAETFIRVKHEANREAMLAEPDKARDLPGVTISSEGEDFEVKPFVPEGLKGAA